MEPPEALSAVEELVTLLRRPTLRTRVGIWRMPLDYAGREPDIAVHLGVEAVDVRRPLMQLLPEGTRYVRLTPEKTLQALDSVACSRGQKDCALVYNMDLLLAGLSVEGRHQVWQRLIDGLPHRERALLIALPETAHLLLPGEPLVEVWQRDKRFV